MAHSTGLLADAGHNLTDVGALALSLVAVRLTLRPASPARSFGNHRATILAALANAVLIAAVTVLIVVTSVHRLLNPQHVEAGIVVAVAAAGLVVNGIAALVLNEQGHDLNMRGALLHMVGDALASAVVVAGLVLLVVPSATWLDPVSSLVVAAIIVDQATGVFRTSIAVLLESTPSDVDLDRPDRGHGRRARGGRRPRPPRVEPVERGAGALGPPGAHRAPDPGGGQCRRRPGQARHRGPFGIAHSTLELECEPCVDVDVDPCAMESATGRRARHHH